MKRFEPQNRGGIWYLVRRVPKEFAHADPRRFAKVSTGIRVADDPRGIRASRSMAALNARLEQDWLDMSEGRDPKARRDLERAALTAHLLGLPYVTNAELGAGPIDDLLRRVESLERSNTGDDPNTVDAVMGGIEKPDLMLSGLLEAFEEEQSASLVEMSEEQIYRWRVNKLRAIRIVTSVVGDKSVRELTRDDAISFRRHFQKRIRDGELSIKSANIEMGHLIKMLRSVELERQIGIPLSAFTNLRIDGGDDRQRPPFPAKFIQERLLAEGALSGLSAEARRIVYVMVETGMRPSEIMNLTPGQIHINAKVPHVSVRPEGRRLKTKPSVRDMPLVGCALAAMRLQPKGFPLYRGRGSVLSTEVNEYLSDAKLRPTPGHTLYGLRHSFEDRLTAIDAPDKIIGRLMGHKGYREKYGDGPSLEHLQGWLERIAFTPPASL